MMNKVRRTIEKYDLLRKHDRVLVAVSGGPDSVALLKILNRLSAQGYDLTLAVAHLNHGLRGVESDREEIFVRRLCESLKTPLFSRKADIGEALRRDKGSLEETCRKERYAFFDELRSRERMNKVALGHHLDDQAETVLMRLLRGSGPEGLRGMTPIRDHVYIRPLIEVTRKEILAFLEREEAAFVEDSSNERDICLRNRIRKRLLPELVDAYNLRLVENLGRMAEIIRMEDDYIQKVVEDMLNRWNVTGQEEILKIPIDELRLMHEALRQRVVKAILLRMSPLKNGIGYRHVKAVMKIINGENPSAVLDMPFNARVRREYAALCFETKAGTSRAASEKEMKRRNEKGSGNTYSYEVEVPGEIDIPEWGGSMSFQYVERSQTAMGSDSVVFVDPDRIYLPMKVRNWMPGDRIEPLGMKGKRKKVQDVFMDEKVPRLKRARIPLLVDRESVIWIPGLRLSERVRVTNRTGRVLKIEIN